MYIFLNNRFPKCLECPKGYTRKYGRLDKMDTRPFNIELPEGQLVRGISEISESECKRKCDGRSDCKSFAYSMNERHCKLMSVHDPPVECDEGDDNCYRDFSWCSQGISMPG